MRLVEYDGVEYITKMDIFRGFLLLILCASLPVSAATFQPISDAELKASADTIVVGTCIARESRWHDRRIITENRIRIESVWKGKVSTSEIILITLGGNVGDIGQHVAGTPQLAVGQQALMFLKKGANGYLPAAWSRGIMPIDHNHRLIDPQPQGITTLKEARDLFHVIPTLP